MNMHTYPSKKTGEIIRVRFELRRVTDTPMNATVTITLAEGRPDPAIGTMRTGAVATAGTLVSALIQGGLAGNTYLVRCTFDTPDGQRLIEEALLPVV